MSKNRYPGPALLSLFLLGASFAGCLGALDEPQSPKRAGKDASSSAQRWAPDEWKAALTKPSFTSMVNSYVYLKAKDGIQLSLTLHLPAPLPASAKVPTLLQLTPYQSLATTKTPQGTSGPGTEWAFFVERGAAYVEADARGSNASDGCLDFGGTADREDAKVFVDWIRAQPWSNGVVVSDGVSHPGMGSVVLHAAVPDLTAALAHAPVVSYYMDEWKQGAKYEDQVNGPGYQAIELVPALNTDPEAIKAQAAPCTGKTLLDYGVVDGPFTAPWADRDLSRHAEKARAPMLLTQGFIDQNVHPDHVQLYWDALPDDFPKHMVLGYWYHGWPDMTGHPAVAASPAATFEALRQRWLDATLFGADNGLLSEPRVLVEDSRGTWHEGDDWPLENSELLTFYPAADKTLGTTAPKEGVASYKDNVPAYRGEWTNAHVAFRTAPLAGDRMVNGAPTLDLYASSSEAETKWVAYLLDEAPDGSWERVTSGYADSHTWRDESQWLPMEPGKTYHWKLELFPTAVVIPAGHRLTLLIASQDARNVNPPEGGVFFSDYRGGTHDPSGIAPSVTAGRAVNTVKLGPGLTHLDLAWIEPTLTQQVPWPAPS